MNNYDKSENSLYTFYYDESEHSRKINQKTIQAGNYSNNFISVIIGYSEEQRIDVEQKFNIFKEKYKSMLVNDEFKSTSIRLKNGFSSITKHKMPFINDFIDLIGEDILFYFSVLNKTEYVINQIFKNYDNSFLMDMDSLRYSICKALSLYKPKRVIDAIYNEGDVVKELKIFLQERIKANKFNMTLKARENRMFTEMLEILVTYNKDFIVDWNYVISFDGFKKYLNENNIRNYTLILDKEGSEEEDSNTLIAARKAAINEVTEDDSKDHVGIQIADMLAGIIAKFIKTLEEDFQYKNIEETTSKKLLSKKWFFINKNQLALYKKMYVLVILNNNSWFKTYSGIYADNFIQFVSLLEYFNNYESFEEYQKVDLELHAEYYNSLVYQDLEDHFSRMSFKLPITPIDDNDGVFYNKKGAKCYIDWTKHEFLEIPKVKSGKTYNVLSVGIFGNMEQPNLTIENNEQVSCYLLPMDLLGWAITCIGLSNMGEKLFPNKVKFGVINDNYYAEVL